MRNELGIRGRYSRMQTQPEEKNTGNRMRRMGVILGCTIPFLFLAVFLLFFVVIPPLASFLFPGYYVTNEEIVRALVNQGYEDVVIKDKSIFFPDWKGCSPSDDALFEVEATNSRGKRVPLIACAGWPFKGVTIRGK